MIKAPYNFVPLEKSAFYPEWANHISQDIPFEDGVSGCIGYTMKAETPIFVRNGYTDREHPDTRFSHTEDGRYFIPGTSVKGEIRSVLEILSFGKMTQVQDARFGIRDLNDKKYRDQLKGVHCGWLFHTEDEEGESYKVIDCGEPFFISPEDIDNKFETGLKKFKETFTCDRDNADKDAEKAFRSAYYKYTNILGLHFEKDKDYKEQIESKFHIRFISEQDKYGKDIATINSNGPFSGTIIVTGQPDKRQKKTVPKTGEEKWTGKYYEFVFQDSDKELPVDKQIADDFFTIHKNNYDFENLWQDCLHKGYKIPVFFTLKDGNVDAIGLSGMFRIPSANFIKGAIPAELQSACRKDLAECIFGSAKKELGYLRGRVTFSPAFATNRAVERPEVQTTLSSPKPSYGPLYVEEGTWNDSNAIIKGRKRYPVRNQVWNNEFGKESTDTKFTPLDKGVEFTGKIYFHNLRKCELGALVSALTFNGHPECYHSIGEAKPLGYGKVRTTICSATLKENTKETQDSYVEDTELKTFFDTYLEEFKSMMTSAKIGWSDSCASIRELQAMARGISGNQCEEFKYMKMDSKDRTKNEFYQAQKDKERLPSFSDIPSGEAKTVSDGDWKRIYHSDIENIITKSDENFKRIEQISEKIHKAELVLSDGNYVEALQHIAYLRQNGVPVQFESRLKALEYTANEIKDAADKRKISVMKAEIEATMNEADVSENNDTKKQLLKAVIQKCDDALQISPDAEIMERKDKCAKELENISKRGRTIDKEFEAYKLNSIQAFAVKLYKWMIYSGSMSLSNEQIGFLGNLVREELSCLNKQKQKAWKDRKGWERAFNGKPSERISSADVDSIFDIATKD